jgi:hypothetical protein
MSAIHLLLVGVPGSFTALLAILTRNGDPVAPIFFWIFAPLTLFMIAAVIYDLRPKLPESPLAFIRPRQPVSRQMRRMRLREYIARGER